MQALHPSLSGNAAQVWLNRAHSSVGWALNTPCWGADGSLLTNTASLTCLADLRLAILRLIYGERTNLMPASEQLVIEAATIVRDVARQRFDSVFTGAGSANSQSVSTRWMLWSAEHDLARGDALMIRPSVPHALHAYIAAWRRMLSA